MKIYSDEYYKLRAISLTKKYCKWQKHIRKSFSLPNRVLSNKDIERGNPKVTKDVDFPANRFSEPIHKELYSITMAKQLKYADLLEYADSKVGLLTAIKRMLKDFGIVSPSKASVLAVLNNILFGDLNPYTKEYKLQVTKAGTIKIEIYSTFKETNIDVLASDILSFLRAVNSSATETSIRNLKSRDREWLYFDRDCEIYLLYLKLKATHEMNKDVGKSLISELLASTDSEKLELKYKFTLDEKLIFNSINRCRKKLSSLQLI